ncbi:fatty-acid--CoA ligase [Mesorhizobium sp. L-8-10]|uniref:class I adenylate-forming enzyme family protein n=1 Tax=Mesorhizobium sp. L-8-10 TaxID=2744523 RepID=UPI0019282E01|nr:AMP-binding protein [Mesorhizobium sp. L-8-10]BCH29878.1 fatty-acid--CoA ligase [Mesorhizobium sp. L-8-10]
MSEMTLGKLVENAARSRGSSDAYVELSRRRTWNEIHQRTDALGWALKGLGIRSGDRVGVISKDAIEVAETIISCAKIGAIRVGLNYRLAGPELAALVADAGIDVLFIQASLVETIIPALEKVSRPVKLVGMNGDHTLDQGYEALVQQGESKGPLPQTPHSNLMICYTTGSTGLPKGAIYPHIKMMESMAAIALCEGAIPDDVWFHAMPASGIPIMHMLRNVFHGSKCAILGDWNAERALKLIEQERCSITVLVPTMLTDLLSSGLIPNFNCSSIRQLGYGSAPLPPSTVREAMKAFGCRFLQMYGTTELMGMAMMMTASEHEAGLTSGHKCLESAGRPLFYVDVKIVDEEGNDVPNGAEGELLIKTEYVIPAYWNQNLNYAETVRDGWLHTGDIAVRDDDGFIYMKDRAKFRIKSGGYNIFPTEIENCIAEHPAVSEVAVFGVPDPKWGDRIVAVISLSPGGATDSDEIREYCRGKIANFKIPKQVHIWDKLPKGPTGKIQKREIIDRCVAAESPVEVAAP